MEPVHRYRPLTDATEPVHRYRPLTDVIEPAHCYLPTADITEASGRNMRPRSRLDFARTRNPIWRFCGRSSYKICYESTSYKGLLFCWVESICKQLRSCLTILEEYQSGAVMDSLDNMKKHFHRLPYNLQNEYFKLAQAYYRAKGPVEELSGASREEFPPFFHMIKCVEEKAITSY